MLELELQVGFEGKLDIHYTVDSANPESDIKNILDQFYTGDAPNSARLCLVFRGERITIMQLKRSPTVGRGLNWFVAK